MVVLVVLPSATLRATFLHSDATSRSRFLSPASLVYSEIIFLVVSLGRAMSLAESPCSFICLDIIYFLAIWSFSSSVYPGR